MPKLLAWMITSLNTSNPKQVLEVLGAQCKLIDRIAVLLTTITTVVMGTFILLLFSLLFPYYVLAFAVKWKQKFRGV